MNNFREKLNILFISNQLPQYRIPILNILSEKINIKYIYSEGAHPDAGSCFFETDYIPLFRLPRLSIQKNNLFGIAEQYDAVVTIPHYSWIQHMFLPWIPRRNYKIIYWTPGVRVSYDKKYDSFKTFDFIRKILLNRADALVFYNEYPIDKYIKMGIKKEKMFVAHNTVSVVPGLSLRKDSILFIGSLYPQKGIYDLLEAYENVSKRYENIPHLNVLGEGNELLNIKNWVEEHGLGVKISILGPVYDLQEKAEYFSRSYACISTKQAGLSVQESFGYGVPFITNFDSITGGERFDIIDEENGILLSKEKNLINTLERICHSPEAFIRMGERAKNYYNQYCHPEIMVKGLLEAIEYVLK